MGTFGGGLGVISAVAATGNMSAGTISSNSPLTVYTNGSSTAYALVNLNFSNVSGPDPVTVTIGGQQSAVAGSGVVVGPGQSIVISAPVNNPANTTTIAINGVLLGN